jgi:Fe-S oxidoreductase
VACPFCLLTLEDAVKILGLEDQLQVMDIMELVALAI